MNAAEQANELGDDYVDVVKKLREIATEDGKAFIHGVCRVIVAGTKSDESSEVIADALHTIGVDENSNLAFHARHWNRYRYIAEMILGFENEEKYNDCGEYVLLKDFIEERIRSHYQWFVNHNALRSDNIFDIFDSVMGNAESSYGTEVAAASEMIGNGIPVFELSGEADGFSVVDESDVQLSFVRLLGNRGEDVTYCQPPDWALRFYLLRRHIEIHDIIFQYVKGRREFVKNVQRNGFLGALAAEGYRVDAHGSFGAVKLESSIDLPDCSDVEKPKSGRRDHQIDAILAVCAALGFDSLSIPTGGKAAIKRFCLLGKRLFTDDGFDDAWKEARKRGLVRMAEQEKFSPL